MESERLDRLLYCLERLRDSPRQVRESVMTEGVSGFFAGFSFALRFALGVDLEMEKEKAARLRVSADRGWYVGVPIHKQMVDRGLSPDEVVAELAVIEIKFLRVMAGRAATGQ